MCEVDILTSLLLHSLLSCSMDYETHSSTNHVHSINVYLSQLVSSRKVHTLWTFLIQTIRVVLAMLGFPDLCFGINVLAGVCSS